MIGKTNANGGGGAGKIASFGSGSWTDISKMLTAHYNGEIKISDYWAVGDSREVELTDGTKDTLTIIDFEHDDLSSTIGNKTKSAITLMSSRLFSTQFKKYIGNYAKWNESAAYDNFKKINTLFPVEMSILLKNVQKKTISAFRYQNDLTVGNASVFIASVFPPSLDEIFQKDSVSSIYSSVFGKEGVIYEYFKNLSNIPMTLDYYIRTAFAKSSYSYGESTYNAYVNKVSTSGSLDMITDVGNSSTPAIYDFMVLMCM